MKNLYETFVNCEVVTDEDIEKIISSFFEEMMVGNLGFSSSAAPEGPVAGFDPVMNKVLRRKKSKKKSGQNNGRNLQV